MTTQGNEEKWRDELVESGLNKGHGFYTIAEIEDIYLAARKKGLEELGAAFEMDSETSRIAHEKLKYKSDEISQLKKQLEEVKSGGDVIAQSATDLYEQVKHLKQLIELKDKEVEELKYYKQFHANLSGPKNAKDLLELITKTHVLIKNAFPWVESFVTWQREDSGDLIKMREWLEEASSVLK